MIPNRQALATALRRLADSVEAGTTIEEVHSNRSLESVQGSALWWQMGPHCPWAVELRVKLKTSGKDAENICQPIERNKP